MRRGRPTTGTRAGIRHWAPCRRYSRQRSHGKWSPKRWNCMARTAICATKDLRSSSATPRASFIRTASTGRCCSKRRNSSERSPEPCRPTPTSMTIDVHTHFIPPSFAADARAGRALDNVTVERQATTEWISHPQGYRYPLSPEFLDVAARLRQMDRLGIDTSILSLAPTLFFYWLDRLAADDFCRQANESLAAFVAQSNRLRGVAAVPLQDPDAAVTELRHAVLNLGLCGVEIGTSMEGVPLDDARFEPFFAAAADLDVPVIL